MKQLRIFTTVWGEKHLDWFKKYCLRSLSFEKNRLAIEDATWCVLTTGEDRPKIEAMIQESGLKLRHLEFIIFGPDFFENPHASGAFINQGLLLEISKNISMNTQMLLAPPDTIFGDGSVTSMREMARQRDSVIFVAHMRVLPDIEVKDNMSNANLVSSAFKHSHATWTFAQDGLDQINSYVGGVSWKYLDQGLFAVTHRLPTPYLINWTPEDIVFFKNQLHWGVIDHAWPHACLIETERMRLVGSSDAAFMVEVTPADANIPPLAAYHDSEPDHFWKNLSHNKVNRMFSVILRAEE